VRLTETLVVPQSATIPPNELARRAQRGCLESTELLVRHFRPRLVLLLSKRLDGTRIDPEDVAQEALTKAFLKIESFNDSYQFSTWVYTIAFRTATDAMRREKRNPIRTGVDLTIHAMRPPAEAGPSSMSVQTIWSMAERVLPQSQFEVLWLRFGEDLSLEDVAKSLGRTRVGTRVLLHRARSRLKIAMEQERQGEIGGKDNAGLNGKDVAASKAQS
jgi:RNA polymerase sigma-70 factor, ECF subfamily